HLSKVIATGDFLDCPEQPAGPWMKKLKDALNGGASAYITVPEGKRILAYDNYAIPYAVIRSVRFFRLFTVDYLDVNPYPYVLVQYTGQ
mgnify:CR=1